MSGLPAVQGPRPLTPTVILMQMEEVSAGFYNRVSFIRGTVKRCGSQGVDSAVSHWVK